MAEDARGIPQNWAELAKRLEETYESNAEYLRERLEGWAKRPPADLPIVFNVVAETMAKHAIVLGPEATSPLFPLFDAHLRQTFAQFPEGPNTPRWVRALGLLSYVNVSRCSGGSVPEDLAVLEPKWVRDFLEVRGLTAKERPQLAYAAAALGLTDLVAKYTRASLPAKFISGEKFALNSTAFLLYLAKAIKVEAPAADVQPAYHEFVRLFPVKLGAEALEWTQLLYAARAYHVHLEHRPVESVTEALSDVIFEKRT